MLNYSCGVLACPCGESRFADWRGSFVQIETPDP